MPLTVFLAVLMAALLHASWNAVVKTGVSKQTSMLLMSVFQALISVVVATAYPWPDAHVWPWLVGSGLVHMAYQLFLAYAYEQGDLSRVYPIARGTAPFLVLLVSLAFLSDPLEVTDLAGIFVLGAGIALIARGVFFGNESRRLLPFALASATATAAYTLIDGLGARVWGEPVAYVAWLMIFSGATYVPAVLFLKGSSVLRAGRSDVAKGFIAAAASFGAYAIAVWAMTLAPIALVGALRETSILFAVLIGWLWFGEKMDRGKVGAVTLIIIGIAFTRL